MDFSTCRHLCRSDLLAVCKNFFVRLLTSSAFSSVSMAADKPVFQVNSLRLAVGFCVLVKAIRESQAIGRCAETDSIEGGEIGWVQAYQRRMRRYDLEIILSALIALVILIAFFLIAW